ncbi:hypothetical protein MJO29_004207 [Puccinia striiformis f. sp. tritici]|uniref:hypothetical protein n=1 Tax=Puccinia striiformis f. sp. tritici TaxID=168172 RepID=UPI002007E250|nr:hypothetical protein Pst134EA_007305 [Puccinia striiformis f. sp. tritici]KAH9460268.1 hypothetical protein Pst134EB_008450 [Puccinia striiformis f. sp. tritici]KAH9470042.1 hypothetical protein Pst134EA_007305 [Puccinia striiformis f. sp. tritici]KAI7963780.1 hypothetical protein MJO29_004207 [Puccinia striiformis f. sp. tritici]KAI9626782.1 hypothetical protein KEM48_010249 [Puccinia striiformis f. sp. tritici PST-130]
MVITKTGRHSFLDQPPPPLYLKPVTFSPNGPISQLQHHSQAIIITHENRSQEQDSSPPQNKISNCPHKFIDRPKESDPNPICLQSKLFC